MNPLEGKALLGSPCITNNPSPKGITYLTNFLEECDGGCDIDFLCTHWYGAPGNEVWNFHKQVNVTIALAQKYGIDEEYVTKFGLTSATVDQKVAFVEEVLPWLDPNPNVGGYAYFMDSDGNLLEGSELNALGTAYANA